MMFAAGLRLRRGAPLRVVRIAFCLVVAIALASLTACSDPLEPPAAAVQELLEVRADRSTEVEDYAPFVVSSELASSLAQAAVDESLSADPPTPGWEAPYVAVETSATADVVVVWESDSRFEEWPVATVFSVEFVEETWVVADAELIEDEANVPARLP
jgi:hypothetical protein